MRSIALLLSAIGAAAAQSGRDATPLLRDVAEAYRNLESYRARGQIQYEGNAIAALLNPQFQFDIALQRPDLVRLEIVGDRVASLFTGPSLVAFCGSESGMLYLSDDNKYRKIGAEPELAGYCRPTTLGRFDHIADNLKSAEITGRTSECTQVHAEYRVIDNVMVLPGKVQRLGRVKRLLCIDAGRNLVVRDRLEAEMDNGHTRELFIQTISYDRVEPDATLPAGWFEFHPPEGATVLQPPTSPQPVTTASQAPDQAVTYQVSTPPEPIARTEPEYSQEAWNEGIMGIVKVIGTVEADGTAHDFWIEKSLGFGLDEKAFECVRQWKFKPATDGGRPVKGHAYITLNFCFQGKRPEKPSAFAVPRPERLAMPSFPAVELRPRTNLEDFVYLVAMDFKAPALCGKIAPLVDGESHPREQLGYQLESLRSACYRHLAAELHDAGLCAQVQPVWDRQWDGSKMDRRHCVAQMGHPWADSVVPRWMEALVAAMRRTGVDDQRVEGFIYRSQPFNNPTIQAYESLRTKEEFLARLHKGSSYDEPRARTRLRDARPLEFLYEMVAVDSGDPSLCSRISPNAKYQADKNEPLLLRSQCYLDIAFSRNNRALCSQLPPAGSFPYVKAHWDSRENCNEVIEITTRDPRARGNYGPAFFPKPADFRTALEQIGYEKSHAASLVAPPSAEDYWDFFNGLRYSEGAERAEFLRRVAALREPLEVQPKP